MQQMQMHVKVKQPIQDIFLYMWHYNASRIPD